MALPASVWVCDGYPEYHLADCHQRVGRWASAWLGFLDVAEKAHEKGELAEIYPEFRKHPDLAGYAEMHEADYSPWEGRDLACWPSLTMLRGKIVVEGGQLKGALSDGQMLSRKIPGKIVLTAEP